jgi:hypothetical protein
MSFVLQPIQLYFLILATFFYAIAFWGAVVPMALRLTPKHPLHSAVAIIGICSSASVAYVILRALTSGPVSWSISERPTTHGG